MPEVQQNFWFMKANFLSHVRAIKIKMYIVIQAQDDLLTPFLPPKDTEGFGKVVLPQAIMQNFVFQKPSCFCSFLQNSQIRRSRNLSLSPQCCNLFFFPLNTQFYQQKKKKKIVSIPGGTQGQVRWGPEQPCLVGGNSAHGTGVYSPLQTQTVL